jgi:hypothetical protein
VPGGPYYTGTPSPLSDMGRVVDRRRVGRHPFIRHGTPNLPVMTSMQGCGDHIRVGQARHSDELATDGHSHCRPDQRGTGMTYDEEAARPCGQSGGAVEGVPRRPTGVSRCSIEKRQINQRLEQ